MPSEIRCSICQGSKKVTPHGAHPSHKAPCGACRGTGISTAPWNQRRKGTTVGVRWEDFQRIGVQERPTGYTLSEIKEALIARQVVDALTERTKILPDLQIHSPGTVTRDHRGRQMLTGILISWANTDYQSRLEQDQAMGAA